MLKNDVKKALYKEKPLANFMENIDGINIYSTNTSLGEIKFHIPDHEMVNEDGKRVISSEVESQYLIRWLV